VHEPAPPDPPQPRYAWWSISGLRLFVFFDKDLSLGSLDPANWTCRTLNRLRHATKATAHDDHVECPCVLDFVQFGPHVCHYAATPPDLQGRDGAPVAPFTDFPVDVVP
jgi:hypothetical protein